MSEAISKFFAALVAIVFGIVFGGIGLVFVLSLGKSAKDDLDVKLRWQPQSCTVQRSEVVPKNPRYGVELEYTYQWGGKERTGTLQRIPTIFGNVPEFESHSDARELSQQYKPGTKVSCFVNPNEPDLAVLESQWPWYALIIPFPTLFLFLGICLVIAPFIPSRETELPKGPLSETSNSSEASPLLRRLGYIFLAGLGVLLLLVSYSIATSLYFTPRLLEEVSQRWAEAKCTVLSSSVLRISGDESDTYKPDILYSYQFEGKTHRSNRYNFFDNHIGGDSRAAETIVKNHAAGSTFTCYFDPGNPNEAVIDRERGASFVNWFGPLIMLLAGGVMAAVGFSRAVVLPHKPTPDRQGIYRYGVRKKDSTQQSFALGRSALHKAAEQTGEKRREKGILVLGQSRAMRAFAFIGISIMAAIWNGIVGLAVYSLFTTPFQWYFIFPAVFLTPFVLIGLMLIVLSVPSFFAIFSPLLRLRVQTASLHPSGSLRIEWSFHGAGKKPTDFALSLEAEEEARYIQGTDSKTDSRIFAAFPVGEVSGHALALGRGEMIFSIPPDAIPSFNAPNNAIVWYIRAHASVPLLPDVFEEHRIQIRPE